ncbi:MAG: DUF4142 domain-containing protein [Hyphomonadaceae bacterium]
MKKILLSTAFAAGLALAACGPKAQDQAAMPAAEQSASPMTAVEAPLDPAAKTLEFATKAVKTSMVSVQTSQAAIAKTKNADVKKFARALAADGAKAETELKAWAGKTTVMLPAGLDGLEKANVDNVVSADAEGFDDKYLDTVIDAQESSVSAFNDYIANGQEPGLKAWAQTTLPALQAQLDQAKALRDKVNAAKSG